MRIEVTEEAAEVLRNSVELMGAEAAGIRLRAARRLGGTGRGLDVQVELAEGPLEGETTLESRGITIFVDPEIVEAYPDAVVELEPQHETVVVRRGDLP